MTYLKSIFPLFCIITACSAADLPKEPAPSEYVIVGRFDEKFPPVPDDMQEFLANKFIQAPLHEHFTSLNTDNWKTAVGSFQKNLVAKAKKQQLPHAALRRSLETILKERGELAIVPIAAYITKLSDQEAWIIVCLWEEDMTGKALISPPTLEGQSPKPKAPEHVTLGIAHIRVFVYYTKDNQLGAFATCL